jgi:hypothetical protein
MPFEIEHDHPIPSDSVPIAELAPALALWVESGADLIEALGSPPKIVKAFERLQRALMSQ